MHHTLLALHGFTMNGEVLQKALGPLSAALSPKVRVVCLNAPHACSEATVARMYAGLASERLSPPHLSWWNATDDGLEYRGWEETFDIVSAALERYAPASVLGFSQGAILATAVAALSQRGELPHVHGAVLIACRALRACKRRSWIRLTCPRFTSGARAIRSLVHFARSLPSIFWRQNARSRFGMELTRSRRAARRTTPCCASCRSTLSG
jgi:pimeloyl-ACP methyl ester carboxylesterase